MIVNQALVLLYLCRINLINLLWDRSTTLAFGSLGHTAKCGLPNGLPTQMVMREWRIIEQPCGGGLIGMAYFIFV